MPFFGGCTTYSCILGFWLSLHIFPRECTIYPHSVLVNFLEVPPLQQCFEVTVTRSPFWGLHHLLLHGFGWGLQVFPWECTRFTAKSSHFSHAPFLGIAAMY